MNLFYSFLKLIMAVVIFKSVLWPLAKLLLNTLWKGKRKISDSMARNSYFEREFRKTIYVGTKTDF